MSAIRLTWLITVHRVWSPEKNSNRRIPSLRQLLDGKANAIPQLPSRYPCKTAKTPDINSTEARYADTAAHEYLHSNLPPSVMAFSQEPIPEIRTSRVLPQYGPIPIFRHREIIRQWVEDIFQRGNHGERIEFSTTVEKAEKLGNEWVLTFRKDTPENDKNQWWQETFDAVVVASGHYSVPFIPKIPGLVEYGEKFPGRVKHTKHYSTAEDFKNQVSG